MRSSQWYQTAFVLVALSGCAAYVDDPNAESEPIDAVGEGLWRETTFTPWSGPIHVCFMSTIAAADRKLIQDTIENGWESAAALNFNGWDTCPALTSTTTDLIVVRNNVGGSNAGFSESCSDATTCGGLAGKAPTGDYNRISFAAATPGTRTILHEFGHALGFMHETDSPTFCVQRTSGGTSLEYEGDQQSVMAAFLNCNTATRLSGWDIIGARATYGYRPAGTLSGVNGLTPNISGGSTQFGVGIVAWDGFGAWNNTFKRRSETSLLLTANTGGTERVLNVSGGVVSPVNPTPVISWNVFEGDLNSQFRFTKMDWLAMGNRCVVVASPAIGQELFIAPCAEGDGSLKTWDFFNGNRAIRLNGTGLCVEVPSGSTTDGTKLKLAPCNNNSASQKFDYANSMIKFGGKALNVATGTMATGNRIILWPASDSSLNERFTILGQVTCLGQCLDMNGAAALGTPLAVKPCNTVALSDYMSVKATNTQVWEYWW
jgi:hypothetical protein